MTIITVLIVCAMAVALTAALIRSAFAGSKAEQSDEFTENHVMKKIFNAKDGDDSSDGNTCTSLRFYCWIANLRELSMANTEGVVDASIFRGPLPLISSREDGSIRIINTERGYKKGSEYDLDISEVFPSETDEIYRGSNRCFSHHEADIIFEKDAGLIHLHASEEKARRNKPASMYSYADGKPVMDMIISDGSCAVIGDYLFIFTYSSQLPENVLTGEEAGRKKTARRTSAGTKKPAARKQPIAVSAKKNTGTAGKRKTSRRKAPARTINVS